MARKKIAAPKILESGNISQEEPEEQGESSGDKPMSKVNAVRAALAEGIDSPEEATDFIKKRYGMEVSKPHFSATKSQLKKKESAAPKARQSRKPKAAVEGYLAPPPKQRSANGEGDLLAAMEAMKPLVAALGAEKVKRIADLLG